jgi:hypothetical protein
MRLQEEKKSKEKGDKCVKLQDRQEDFYSSVQNYYPKCYFQRNIIAE